MINRYMKHVAKPIAKRETVNKKEPLFKKVADSVLIGLALGLIFNTVAQASYDIVTNNEIVDADFVFGSIVFSHKDVRTTEQLFNDIEQRIFAVEGIEKVFKDAGSLTISEKERIFKEVIRVIADESNIATKDYVLKEMIGRDGFYFTMKNSLFSISGNNISINENAFGLVDFKETLKLGIHEMWHAVEDQNRMKGKTVSKFDKKVFYSTNQPTDYMSSPNELNAFLFSTKIISDLETYFNARTYTSESLDKDLLPKMFLEIIYNLYDVDTFTNHDLSFMPFEYSILVSGDVNDYKLLTLDELIVKGFEKKLDSRDINYSGVDLRNSYYYESFSAIVNSINEDLLDVRYVDYVNKTYDVTITDVEQEIAGFEAAIETATSEHNQNILIANNLARYSNIFRYQMDAYTDEQKDILSEQILKYIGQVSNENMKIFGLEDVKEKLTERESFRTGIIKDAGHEL